MNFKRILSRIKHSPRRRIIIDKRIIIALLVVALVIPLSFFGYQNITGMHSIEDVEASEQQIYDEINQMRIDNQLPPLNRSLPLQAIAKEHSKNIATGDNLTRDYVRAFAQKNLDCTFHAEDVQKTNKVELNETYILDPKMEKVGIGIVVNKSIYITQDFCG